MFLQKKQMNGNSRRNSGPNVRNRSQRTILKKLHIWLECVGKQQRFLFSMENCMLLFFYLCPIFWETEKCCPFWSTSQGRSSFENASEFTVPIWMRPGIDHGSLFFFLELLVDFDSFGFVDNQPHKTVREIVVTVNERNTALFLKGATIEFSWKLWNTL